MNHALLTFFKPVTGFQVRKPDAEHRTKNFHIDIETSGVDLTFSLNPKEAKITAQNLRQIADQIEAGLSPDEMVDAPAVLDEETEDAIPF
jgi:hypothetical protein